MLIRYKKTVLTVLLLALAVVGYGIYQQERSAAFMAFLDVGQGDAILAGFPGGVQILVDGGPSDIILDKLARYVPFYDRTIELVVLTHPHSDHARGISEMLEVYSVKNVLLTGVRHDSSTYQHFLMEGLEREGAAIYIAEAGDYIMLNGVPVAQVLYPQEKLLGQEVSDPNQTSVVLELIMGGHSFLLTGDVEEGVERSLVRQGMVTDIDVLKVGHQGSKNATSPSFLASVLPEVAVISVGQNSYGHPSEEVVARLESIGTQVLRTDEHGDVVWRFK